jgi:FixJ family two-component response regulator
VHHAAEAPIEREVKVLRQVAAGNPNKIVAAQLSITEETVKASDVPNTRRTKITHSFTHSWPFHQQLPVTYSAGWHL